MSTTDTLPLRRFEGRVVFVTGAARGQGRAICERFAAEGADVIATDICGPVETSQLPPSTTEDLAATVALVEGHGRRIHTYIADVRDLEGIESGLAKGVERFGGRLDVVAANAGIVTAGRTWELTEQQWRTMLDVNLTGVWNTVRSAIPKMIAAGNGGSVVITSSLAGLRGIPFEAHYCASKHGLVGLAKTLALEAGDFKIRVNTIHPGVVDTAMRHEPVLVPLLQSDPRLSSMLSAAIDTGFQRPDDVARTIAWLSSDEARFITGAQIPLESGNLLR